MTNKKRYEAFYKERGLEEFINLIIRNYQQLPGEYKMYDPATALLSEPHGKSPWEKVLPKCLDMGWYTPKAFDVADRYVADKAMSVLKDMNSPHSRLLTDVASHLSAEERLYYILGAALDLPVYERNLPLMADTIYSVMRVLEKQHNVTINIPDECEEDNLINVFGRLFCTGKNARYEMLYGLQKVCSDTSTPYVLSNNALVHMVLSYSIPMADEIHFGIVSEASTDMIVRHLFAPKPYHKIPSAVKLCILYNIGARLLSADSGICIAKNADKIYGSNHPTRELFYSTSKEK